MTEIDFSYVEEKHTAIHTRLENWASWVQPRKGPSKHPMWRFAKSNAFQWHPPEIRKTCDTADAQRIEKAVAALPGPHGYAIRWCYVHRTTPARACRDLATNKAGLMQIIRDGRQMLVNRL